jgi:hypothetical protein
MRYTNEYLLEMLNSKLQSYSLEIYPKFETLEQAVKWLAHVKDRSKLYHLVVLLNTVSKPKALVDLYDFVRSLENHQVSEAEYSSFNYHVAQKAYLNAFDKTYTMLEWRTANIPKFGDKLEEFCLEFLRKY